MTKRPRRRLVLVTAVLVVAQVSAGDTAGKTIAEFTERHPIVSKRTVEPARYPDPADDLLAIGSKFDDAGAHAGYEYAPSIAALRDVFRRRAERGPSAPSDRRAVRAAIASVFGTDRFGRGFRLLREERVSASARISRIAFEFGDGGFGQALVGLPTEPNGRLLIAIHGCSGSPSGVMLDAESYSHAFGLRAVERGYTVVAPYILSQCPWIHNLDWLGALSGVSVFGYELLKIAELATWARATYATRETVIWGISLGGQMSMLSAALDDGTLFDVAVISGAAANYEESYRRDFDAVGIDAAKKLGDNRQVALSAVVSRADLVASILPRPIVFEISTGDLRPSVVEFVNHVEEAALKLGAGAPKVVLFEGGHETNPQATLDVLQRTAAVSRPWWRFWR